MRQNINKGRERLFQGNFYRCRIDGLGAGNIFIEVVALEAVFRVAGAVEVNLHRLRVEIGAILELHAGSELNGIDQPVIRDGVPLCQHIFQLHLSVQAKQPLVERLGDRLRQRIVGVIGIKGGEIGADGNHHIFGSERGRGGQGCRHARG